VSSTAHLSPRPLRPLQRLALGGEGPGDPNAYATVEVRMDAALARMASTRAAEGQRVGQRLTVTHLVAKAAADVLRRHPEANVLLRFGRPWLRRHVTVCCLVVQREPSGKVDLGTATVADADRLSLRQLARELDARIEDVRQRRNARLESGRRNASYVPTVLMNGALALLSFVWFTLNRDLGWAGMPHDPFGSVAVTSVGSLGLERAFVASVGYTRVPLLLAPGSVRTEAVVEEGRVRTGPRMTLSLTFDARVISVPLAGRLLSELRRTLEDPAFGGS
jgi:pyruvate/2-oxoglutarate dehydrogenase complex dihydrolipoamide acyltransferase (E2) component